MSLYRAGPPTYFATLAGGVAGIRQTLRMMCDLVRQWKLDPGIRQLALELVQPLPQNDYAGEVAALHAFVRDRIRYVGDIADVETLHTPRRILEQAAGDCDDKSILLATLLKSINHPAALTAGAFEPGVFSHVWVDTYIGGAWYPLETTKPVPPGWMPPGVVDTLTYHC